jgi:hypothetical protein
MGTFDAKPRGWAKAQPLDRVGAWAKRAALRPDFHRLSVPDNQIAGSFPELPASLPAEVLELPSHRFRIRSGATDLK